MDLPWAVLKIYQETSEKAKDTEKTLLRPFAQGPLPGFPRERSLCFLFRNLRAALLIKKGCSPGFYCLASSHRTHRLHPAPLETASSLDTEKPTMQSLK